MLGLVFMFSFGKKEWRKIEKEFLVQGIDFKSMQVLKILVLFL